MIGFTLKRLICFSVEMNIEGEGGGGGDNSQKKIGACRQANKFCRKIPHREISGLDVTRFRSNL